MKDWRDDPEWRATVAAARKYLAEHPATDEPCFLVSYSKKSAHVAPPKVPTGRGPAK